MPTLDCPCGLNYDSLASPSGCPQCGKPSAPPSEDKIRFSCPVCGLRLTSSSRFVGKSIECLACGKPAPVPAASRETVRAATTTRRPPPPPVRPATRPDGWRSTARWSMLLALIPLALYTFSGPDDLKARIEETKKQYPEVVKKMGRGATIEDFCAGLPSHRIVGAALANKTSAHWMMALLSALIFWEFILIIQPMGNSTSRQLWAVGIFTGTIGILLLLIITVSSVIAGLLHIPFLGYIGDAYAMAVNPETGFVASMLGFTVAVGFLEELCKALPLYWHFRRTATLDVRGSVVWGLATGIGFGVSEGISYSSSFYNGMSGGGVYVVRFISCVSLHAIWSGTVAILIWRRQERIQHLERFYQWIPVLFMTLSSSMVIHGFYDTCLKKEYGVAALASAMLSFAVFFWLYDRACREERQARPDAAFA